MTPERSVAVVPLGGTIACVPAPGGGSLRPSPDPNYMRRVLDDARSSADDLPQAYLVPVSALASAELDATQLVSLAGRLRHLVDDGACGIVVTTGTDTLEEVAFVLDLLWDRQEPLVVVGAMRHNGLPGHDGAANLRDALRVAAHRQMRSHGVLVTMAGQVHHSWQIRKGHTGASSAFYSAVTGPVGLVQEDTVRVIVPAVIDRPRFGLEAASKVPAVALVKTVLGDDGRMLETVESLGYSGLVLEVMGGGSVPPTWMPKLENLARTMPIVYSPRTNSGPALKSTYGSVGAELDLQRIGAIPTGLLDGLKSRLLLALLLATQSDQQSTKRAFSMFNTPAATGSRPFFASADSEK